MPDTINTDATIACSAITIVTTLALAITSHYEHYRNPRPSSPVSIFLVLTFVFECAKTRTLFGIVDGQPVALMALVATFIKFFLVLLEAKEKREWLLDPDRFQAPESTANYFNRLTFFWVNPLLFFGYKHQIQEADLFEVQKQIVGDREMLLLAESWDRCKDTNTEMTSVSRSNSAQIPTKVCQIPCSNSLSNTTGGVLLP
jgi:hypothetical protein